MTTTTTTAAPFTAAHRAINPRPAPISLAPQIAFTRFSRNAKTGQIPVTTSSAETCPDACPLKKNGCYADSGPLGLFWRKVTERRAGLSFTTALDQIRALPKGTLWRHNQSGDLAGAGDLIDRAALDQLISANRGKRGFTYTHKPMTADNAAAVAAANQAGFTINLSANDLSHADQLADLGIAPVAVVLPADLQRQSKRVDGSDIWTESLQEYRARIGKPKTAAGRSVAICPATYQDQMTCERCGLCAVAQRRAVVGFPAHGTSKRKASAIAQGAALQAEERA